MGSRRTRFAALFIALALALLSVAGVITAGTAKAGNTPNPVTGCSEDSFFAGAQTPDPSTPIVTPINTDITISTIYFDESPINTNPGFLPFYTVKDSLGNVVATGSPTQGPPPAGTNLDKFQTLLTATFQVPAKGTYVASIKAWDGDQNKAGGDCGVAMWNVKTPDPGKIVLHKTDDGQPANPLQGAVFGVWQGSTVSGNPLDTCTSLADGTCTFSGLDPDTYTIKETQAPAGYTADPGTATVTVASNQTSDITKPFVDPRDTGWARIVKVLKDGSGTPVTVADKHVLDGASFILYSDNNPHNGAFDAGEQAKLWPSGALAGCTISGGTGQCDIGPVLPGAYRVHETVAPPHTTAGPDVDVTIVKSTQADPVVVNYANIVADLNINLIKSGPSLAHVGDTFAYTFDATVGNNAPRLHNIQLQELVPNRCTTAISGPSGDTNGNGFLEPGETWHWSCNHTVTSGDPNPLPNSAKVTGTDDFGRSVSATADHTVIIIHPRILVEKSGPASAHEGDTVTYTFKVTNTGDAALSNVALNDDKLGVVGTTISVLSAGDSQTFTKDSTVPVGSSVDNTVTACGIDPLSLKVCDDDHHHLVILHPGILVEKSGPATAHVGDKVTYTFKVTNTGDDALSNVAVTDDKLGSIGTIPSLAIGASTTLTKDFTVPDVAAVDNTVTACGTDPLAEKVCDDDHHHLVTIHPAITVDKTAASQAHEGDVVTYTFKVTNTGDVPLTNVAVTDDKLGPIGTVGDLAVGASTTLKKDFTVPTPSTGAIVNRATVCGDDPLQKEVCDHHDHHLDPIHPKIAIVKDGPALAHVGDTITYKFTVTNPGDVALHNVALTDPKCDAAPNLVSQTGGNTDAILDLTETWVYNCDHKITASDPDPLPNTGTVTGVDPLDKTVTAKSSHSVDIIHPAIKVEKSGPAEAHEGDTVTYTFKVTNTGDVALSNVTVVDNVLGNVGTISSLDIGASTTLTKDFKVPSPSTGVDNTVTACGSDPLAKQVCDDDHHHLTPKHPAITVVKSGPATATAGQTVTYTFKVTNTGDIDLNNVQASDDKLGSIGTVASLPIGASTTLTKDFTVPSGVTVVDNTVTACGTDTLSLQVCGTDKHHMDVTQVLGENVVRQPLAVTGTDLGWRSLIGLLLLVGGVSLRVMRRRNRRSEG